jgi:hypothetical protein
MKKNIKADGMAKVLMDLKMPKGKTASETQGPVWVCEGCGKQNEWHKEACECGLPRP